MSQDRVLLDSWADAPFAHAIAELARAANVSRSELIRQSLAQTALRLAGAERLGQPRAGGAEVPSP